MDCSLPGSSVYGIFQVRILEWGAIAFSDAAVQGVAKSRTGLSDFTFTFHFHAWEEEMELTPVFLPREPQGLWGLVGCRLWGRTESDTTEAT